MATKTVESFRPPFSKGGADPTRGALVALRRERNSLSFESATKGEFRRSRKRETHKWGFPFLYIGLLLIVLRFSFGKRGAKEKLTKERRRKGDFALCGGRPTLRALDGRKPLKRLDRNFNAASRCSHEAPHKPQFITTL